MKYIIGIDLGTSSIKSVLFSTKGEIINSSSYEFNIIEKKETYAEEDPNEWLKGAKKTIKDVANNSNIDPLDIVSIGISGQMHGLVLLDEFDNVIRDSIIWCDTRTKKICENLSSIYKNDFFLKKTGNKPMIAFTLAKILWVKENEKENFDKISKILLPKDYIKYMLTNSFSSELSDLSGTQLLNLETLDYDEELLKLAGLNKSQLPKICLSSTICGSIKEEIAKLTGLSTNVKFVSGAGDQAACALGNGVYKSSQLSVSLGSSGVVFGVVDNFIYDPNSSVQTFLHATNNQYHIMGVTQACGTSVKWFKNNFFKDYTLAYQNKDYEVITKEMNKTKKGANGIIFLPYLLGERSPIMDVDAKGIFFGLKNSSTRIDMLQAVFEGIAFSLKDCFLKVKEFGNFKEIIACGGGTKNPIWVQALADIFEMDIKLTDTSESGALGAAILASVGSNIYKDFSEAVKNMVHYKATYKPDESSFTLYRKYFKIYKKLYLNNKELFKIL